MSSDHHGHIEVPIATSRKTLIALLILTVVTVGASKDVSGIDFGAMATVIAMAIATVKAVFVGMFFMQLKYDDKLYTVMLLVSVLMLLLLFVISGIDIYSRILEVNPL